MAAPKTDVGAQCRALLEDVRRGIFKPVYLLMGDEPYYPDLVCNAIVEHCIDPSEKDFNELICYGADVTADQIVTTARQFPMMAERQLVVVKDANLMKGFEELAVYCAEPLESTVLVLLLRGASADKRKSLYKTVQKTGVVVDSPLLRDYQISGWISSYYASRGLVIDPEAAALLAESVGTDLGTIAVETDKLLQALPEGCQRIGVEDIEKNIGISRRYSVFELTKELSARNAPKALKIAARMGTAAKFSMPGAVSMLALHFIRILKYGALLARDRNPSPDAKAAALEGVNPYFYREYDMAVRNYPPPKALQAISLLCEYDYLGKGGDGGLSTPPDGLLLELIAKLLNV